MKFDKNNLNEIRKDFKEAVKTLENKYGVVVNMGNISYSELEFTSKITVISAEKNSEENEKAEFEKYCCLYGLTKDDYGVVINCKGIQYKVIGFNASRPKYCIKAKAVDNGKIFFFSETILTQIKR